MQRFRFFIAVPMAALLVLSGYGASSLLAGASSSPKTYFACLSGGTLTKVGTKSPTCSAGAKVISWNQVGPTGPPGAKGDTGAAGSKGDTGAPGSKGDAGANGATGTKGDIGPQGPKGDTGAKGDVGLQGPKGDIGPQGPPGPQAVHVSPSCHPWFQNNYPSTDMVGCNLRGVDVEGHLNGMNLTGADLRRDNIGEVKGAILDGADLRLSVLSPSNSDFQGANLGGARITFGQYDDFTGANLRAVDLRGNFDSEVFDGADLTEATVGYASFVGSSFVGANIDGIDWSHATCPDNTFGGDNPGSTCVGHGPGL